MQITCRAMAIAAMAIGRSSETFPRPLNVVHPALVEFAPRRDQFDELFPAPEKLDDLFPRRKNSAHFSPTPKKLGEFFPRRKNSTSFSRAGKSSASCSPRRKNSMSFPRAQEKSASCSPRRKKLDEFFPSRKNSSNFPARETTRRVFPGSGQSQREQGEQYLLAGDTFHETSLWPWPLWPWPYL